MQHFQLSYQLALQDSALTPISVCIINDRGAQQATKFYTIDGAQYHAKILLMPFLWKQKQS